MGTVSAHTPDKRAYMEELLLNDPSMSINSVAREVNARFRGQGVHTGEIARIRRMILERIGAGHEKRPVRAQVEYQEQQEETQQEPFNPPRLVTKEDGVEEKMTAVKKDTGTAEERRRWFETWALDNPDATVDAARSAIQEHFGGVGIGTSYIVEIMQIARRAHVDRMREAAGLPLLPTPEAVKFEKVPAKAPAPADALMSNGAMIEEMVKFARLLGVKKLELRADGKYDIEMAVVF